MVRKKLDEESIYHVARKIEDVHARAEYLDQICDGDDALHGRIKALLDADDEETDFLKSVDGHERATVDHVSSNEKPGSNIGRYKLMEQIGEGGMGTVFVAQQEKPIRRKVALKVIKPGMDSKAVIARFEAERQALAMMDHPNIAKVLDAGTTESGHPYFAMELVKGVPITEYCDRNKLTIRERLVLFNQVCHAIQHAHQKGIIHRDIKPSNLLVTLHDGKPVPKVIDFGVAKALNARLTDKTIYTEHLQVVGTLLYMSPEQAELSGLDVDTRSDIYSLGVLLYELLTGTTPFQKSDLNQAGFDEQRRMIRDKEPPRASVRISSLGETATTVAEHRQTEAKKLSQLVRKDLDWIVLKSLEKDRTRRYDTAIGFAEDVERFLADEPVEARPPSLQYRATKFVKRNRVGVGIAGLMFFLLGLGITAVIWQSRQTQIQMQAKIEAMREKDSALENLADVLSNLKDALFDQGLLMASSGNPDSKIISDQLKTLGDIERSQLIESFTRYSSGKIIDQEILQQAKNAASKHENNVALQAFLSLCYDAGGVHKDWHKQMLDIYPLEPKSIEDRLFLAKALQGDIKAVEYVEQVCNERKSYFAILMRGRIGANHVMQSGDLTRADSVLADVIAATSLQDLKASANARVDTFASCVELASAAKRVGNDKLWRDAMSVAKRIKQETHQQPMNHWDNFYQAYFEYEHDNKPQALKLYRNAASTGGYFYLAYLALNYEIHGEMIAGENVKFKGDCFYEFGQGIQNVQSNPVETEKIAINLCKSESNTWAHYFGLSLLALTGSAQRKSVTEDIQRKENLPVIEKWIYDHILEYHKSVNAQNLKQKRTDLLQAANNSIYPVVFRHLAYLTFGLEELGKYEDSDDRSNLELACEYFHLAAENEIVYYLTPKLARAYAVQTRKRLTELDESD